MTFSPVIPTTWDPTRQKINDFIDAIITAFQAQVVGVIRQQWSEVPETYTAETPLVYIGPLVEEEVHDAGLRVTTFTGELGYVDISPDNQEANTRANSFADYMREVFTANARIYSTGIFQQRGLREGAAIQGPISKLQHLVLDYTFVLQEGRN